ncbi:MAG: hypothetical protein ACREN5_07680 [Gemmatimonadales bacterium]
MRRTGMLWLAMAGVMGVACRETVFLLPALPPPADLRYELEPSGEPGVPAGILLRWTGVSSGDLEAYRIYSRGAGGNFVLRAQTTSTTFHDTGVPHLEYYVTAQAYDGSESEPSNVITIDERLALPAPASLVTTSLNGAVHLAWSDNAFSSRFLWYRVYSATYDLDADLCGTFVVEGTTVSPDFLVTALSNGVPRCFGVSALSVEGYESLWSPVRADTPRPDARNVLMFAYQADTSAAGFRFHLDLNGDGRAQPNEALGLVTSGNRTDIDFWIWRDPADSTLWFVPERTNTEMRLYSDSPIADLTDIDVAPVGGYSRDMFQAAPGYGYVFEIVEGSMLHYGALRVTHVGRNYLIFDWSYQTDRGNPELVIHAGLPVASGSGIQVHGVR